MKLLRILAAASICLAFCLLAACGTNTSLQSTTSATSGSGQATVTAEITEQVTSALPTTTQAATTASPQYGEGDKLIAFTFDDGPRVKTTGRILDALEKTGSKATFFVLGENVSDKGTVLRRAISLGCEIGNHTMNHKNLTKLSDEKIAEQISLAGDAVEAATGLRPTLLRAPGGNFKGVESKVGFPLIQWSIDTNDWRYSDNSKPGRSTEQRNADIKKVSASVLDYVKPGDIILMHDIYDFSADVFESVLPELISRGYKLVTVTELYEHYGKELEPGRVYRGINLEKQTTAS